MYVDQPLHRYAFWVIVIGMGLRILWALVMPVNPVSDSVAYDTFARNLVQHGVYGWTQDAPTAYWAVGTSAIVAGTYLIFGVDNYTGVVLTNLAAGWLSLVMIWRITALYFDVRVALAALVIMALWPTLIMFTTTLSSELYFIALTLLGLWFWARPGRWWLNLLLAGLVWGAACYVRPVILLFPVALVIASLSQGLVRAALTGARAATVIGLIILIVAPWTARNEAVMGEAFLVSSNFGPNLWMGNNPDSTGGYMPLPEITHTMNEAERNTYLEHLAKTYIQEDLGRFARDVVSRTITLHNRETIGVAWNLQGIEEKLGTTGSTVAKIIASGYWYLLLLAALAGVIILLKNHKLNALFHPIFGSWAYFTAIHAIIVAEDRYHIPATPFIAIIAAVGVVTLIKQKDSQTVSIKNF